ncbi:MAG: chorismate synthase [Nitrospirae bacterium]|nr:chorismate synthase [Nitrospirota bacterium]
MRFVTAGESHGPALVGIIEGLPAGMDLSADMLANDMLRRKMGYGRGGRMKIESDDVRFLSGVRRGKTLGSPITVFIENRDFRNWEEDMDPAPRSGAPGRGVFTPRPGHADYAGAVKYFHRDLRNVLERASARETATRVALGGIARQYLRLFGIEVASFVLRIGAFEIPESELPPLGMPMEELREKVLRSEVFCPVSEREKEMIEAIRAAKKAGDTLGGIFEVRTSPLPVGLGSYVQWDRRLDGEMARALMSIQAIKGVEAGLGFEAARRPGSAVHDPFVPGRAHGSLERTRNHAGGLEGGVTNGQPLWVRAAMKPISTLYSPLPSVDIRSGEPSPASVERSDICAVPAASVVGEAMVCLTLAGAASEKFGGDSVEEVLGHFRATVGLKQEWESITGNDERRC